VGCVTYVCFVQDRSVSPENFEAKLGVAGACRLFKIFEQVLFVDGDFVGVTTVGWEEKRRSF